MLSEITALHDKRQRDTAIALLDARLDTFDMLYIHLDQAVSCTRRDALPLGDGIPGRQRYSAADLVSRIRASMDRLEATFAEAEPIRHLQAAE